MSLKSSVSSTESSASETAASRKKPTANMAKSSQSSAPAQRDINEILEPVRPGLTLVEAKMKTVEAELFTPLANAFVDLIGSGGKRLRPAVALAAVNLQRPKHCVPIWKTDQRVISLSASVEMLHTATLVHDDVIDGALLRRGAPTLNAQWNRGATVLAGDFMFARAAYFSAETGSTRVIQIFSDTLGIIVNGELRQLWARRQFHQSREEYFERIEAKTASLFRAATEAAGVLADMAEEDIQHLRKYGYHLGVAFQIVDDILDFTGSQRTLGKPAGSDLLQGTLTLPFFHYAETLRNPDALLDELDEAYDESSEDDESWRRMVADIVADVKGSSAIDEARSEAIGYLNEAKACLADFPYGVYKATLIELCDFVVQRTN